MFLNTKGIVLAFKKHVRFFPENTYMFWKTRTCFWGYNGDRWCKATPIVPLGIVSNMATPILTQGGMKKVS